MIRNKQKYQQIGRYRYELINSMLPYFRTPEHKRYRNT